MKVRIAGSAEEDLGAGYWFYEKQCPGLRADFYGSLECEIGFLAETGGTHRVLFGKHRVGAGRFPFWIFYTRSDGVVFVRAVIDQRGEPASIRELVENS